MTPKRPYFLIIVCAALISITGCYAKELGWAITSPEEIKEGQIVSLQTKEEKLIDVYTGDGTENPRKIKTDQLTINIVNKDSFGISGVLVEAYDFSSMSYIQNNNTNQIVEVKFDEIGDLGLWERKLMSKSRTVEESNRAETFGMWFWLILMLSPALL